MEATAPQADKACYTVRETCRACDAKALTEVLDLGNQYLPRYVSEPDETLPRAPLVLARCASCGLLQLLHQVEPDLLYRQFWYRTGMNLTMRTAMQDLVDEGMEFHTSGTWLDIGANDGYLLSQVPDKFRRIACEPALNFGPLLKERCEEVIPDYFTADYRTRNCQVITSAAMFYDLNDPGRFIDDIVKSLALDGVWINQLNDAPTMMKRGAFDSICHEHACYYDVPTLQRLYEAHGLVINRVSFNEVNGGSVRVTARRRERARFRADTIGIPAVSAGEAEGFARRTVRWRHVMGELLPTLAGKGLWAYGASTKGSTLMQYLDMADSFMAVADKNPDKHGLRMVGTWLPITNEGVFRSAKPGYAFVLPWAFRDEFVVREANLRQDGTAMLFPLPNPEIVL